MEENIVKRIMTIIGITIVLPVLFGCSNMRETKITENWGRSYETARFSQIVNPDAGESMVKDQDMDGIAAKYNHDKYQEGFKKEDTSNEVFDINLGEN